MSVNRGEKNPLMEFMIERITQFRQLMIEILETGGQIKLGIDAPQQLKVLRYELVASQ